MDNKGCCAEKPADNSCSTEKMGACAPSKCCWGTVIKGALIGGIIMFAVFAASWMLLPWHKAGIMSFANEAAVAGTLSANAVKSGVYMLPGMPAPGAAPAATKPFAFVSVFADGIPANCMTAAMIQDFLLCLFGAALLTKLLKKSSSSGCCPVALSMVIGLLVGTFSYLPNMIWFHFPLNFTLLGLADTVVAITLAGAAISKCVLSCGPKMGNCGDKKASCG